MKKITAITLCSILWIFGFVGLLATPVEASPSSQYLVEVDTQGLDLEVYVDERYKDEVSVIIDEKIYSINEDNQLVDTKQVFIQPFGDYSQTFTIPNGQTKGFDRIAHEGIPMMINCSGDLEMRKAYIVDSSTMSIIASVTGNYNNIGTGATAPHTSTYSFNCTNMSAVTGTWTITASF